jgi:flagellar biosynthesis protein FlhG
MSLTPGPFERAIETLVVHPASTTARPDPASRVIAVASGKGGVGKTNLAINLGLSLARRGLRVGLLDADLGTANVDVLMGIQPRYNLQHVVTGQRSLAQIIVAGPYGLQIIPGASGLPDLVDLPEAQRDALLRALLVLSGSVDLLLIDTSAGVGRNVVQFILAAGEVVLLTTPEPTAIVDAYALMKILASYQVPVAINLVVNCVRHGSEGDSTGHKLAAVVEQFLGRRVRPIGTMPYDQSVLEAVKAQVPLMHGWPRSPAALAIDRIGEQLWSGLPARRASSDIGRFFRYMLSSSPVACPIGASQ